MSLIEQLGSYSAAKNWLDKNEIHVKHGYMEKYQRELLEYRRAHSIFEVEDNVVFDSKYSKDSKVFKIDSDRSGKMGIRHATDAEIEVGHRL